MKMLLALFVLVCLGLFYYMKTKKVDQAINKEGMTYTTSLQNDEKRAADATQKANALLQQTQQETEKAGEETEKK
jgi:hypothetical protein